MLKKFSRKIKKLISNYIEVRKLRREYHMKVNKILIKNGSFKNYYMHIKVAKPFTVIFEIIILYLIFHFFGLKIISLFFAIAIVLVGIIQILFLITLENKILDPISKLECGVREIAGGNYNVNIKCSGAYEVNLLVDSFNNMAKKLYNGEKIKAEYEKNRKDFIANISHDLRTPITSIQAYAEAILERTDIPKSTMSKYYRIIYNNAVYMNKLIDDLFLFSKLDMQKLELNFNKLKIKDFMGDLMEEFKLELEDRQIKFYYEDYIDENYYVNIDGKRVCQIFKNIIDNAVKYGNDDGIVIKVKLYRENDSACVDVMDNGHGIPRDKLPHIFDRFYRVDCARTKNLMSTGLGLAIAKELVEAHGGKINVSSVESEGTCFKVMFPLKK